MFLNRKKVFVSVRAFWAFLLLASSQAQCFMTVQESNEITPAGQYKIGVEPQFRTSNGNGFNFSGFFDAPLSDAVSARAVMGTGDTDFLVGGSLKWVPVPDYQSQPAVGGKVGLNYWRENTESFFTFRFEPIVSKKFQTDVGVFVPYGALPINFNSGKDNNGTGIQLAVGSEYLHSRADNMTFGAELGFNAKDSFSYISGYVTIYLDATRPSPNNRK
jgi:hypothetical protein